MIYWGIAIVGAADSTRILDARRYHLGTPGEPEWQEFAADKPYGRRLDIRFPAESNAREATLFIRQDDVKLEWGVELNGRKIGQLLLMEAPLWYALPVLAGTLRNGENTLTFTPPKQNDDIIVGDIKLDSRPLQEVLEQCTLDLDVSGVDRRGGIPCRITIVDRSGDLMPLHASAGQTLAVRPGVVYTPDGKARLGVQPGDYTLYATRGFEYSLAAKRVSIRAGQTKHVRLQLRREVPTPGLVSSDTHVHTFTYSRHGDATIDERMITLAGEGIELPIATDHDMAIDYAEPARRMRVNDRFTPVIGCEVTTPRGHFNIFPVLAGSPVPDARIEDWPLLMKANRSTPGVRVVVLNHPRNIHSNFQPFAATNFNAVTGENRRGPEFSFDAIEVANSSALQSDLELGFRDWFALLNYGYRVTAVGSSDVHDVSRYIVGQGRCYVACDDSHPGQINIEEACRSFLQGRVLVSLGLLTQMRVDDRFAVGDLATGLGEKIRVTVTVLGPSWASAEKVELFADGVKIRERKLTQSKDAGKKARITWELSRPAHDVHLVAIAWGPAVTAPYWAISKPYQPSSRVAHRRVLGATNPIWIDGDGDGKFTSARSYAKTLIERIGTDPAKLIPALARYDEAVVAQAAGLCQAAGREVRADEFTRLFQTAPESTQRGFAAFAATLPR